MTNLQHHDPDQSVLLSPTPPPVERQPYWFRWSGTGAHIATGASADEALHKLGNFTVESRPIYSENTATGARVALSKRAVWRTDSNGNQTPIGEAGSSWQPVQPMDVAQAFDALRDSHDQPVKPEIVIDLRYALLIGWDRGEFMVKGDRSKRFGCIVAPFVAGSATKLLTFGERPSCTNQITSLNAGVALIHRGAVKLTMAEWFQRQYQESLKQMQEQEAIFNRMADAKLTTAAFERLVDRVFPLPRMTKLTSHLPGDVDFDGRHAKNCDVVRLLRKQAVDLWKGDADDGAVLNTDATRNTVYGGYHALSAMVTWVLTPDTTRGLAGMLLGDGERRMQRIFSECKNLVGGNN